MNDASFSLDDYDFELPAELIAQSPAESRDGSRLLVLEREDGSVSHRGFGDLLDYLRDGDLLVLNDTEVIPARCFGRRESSGGKAEALFLGPEGDGLIGVLLKTRGRLEAGEILSLLDGGLRIRLIERGNRGRWTVELLECEDGAVPDLEGLLRAKGVMPLPPYIRRAATEDPRAELDRKRYQTVFARHAGAVAAPTAGLHFTEALLAELSERGVKQARVTLHVGLGTFQPVEVEDFREHDMHEERFTVSDETARRVNETRAAGGRVVAVGTTSVRSLESAWDHELGEVAAMTGSTRIFIHPPKRVASVDALLTNFHLPKSTLLLLVSAMAGRERILSAYEEAIERNYRFFSYGDAMLIL